MQLRNHTVKVTIPEGVTHGQRLRLAGQGEARRAAVARAIFISRCTSARIAAFSSKGATSRWLLPIAPWEAALGATVTVPTLGGSVEMRIPPGRSRAQKLRLRGRGLPGDPPGDQMVQLKIVMPPADTPEAKTLYEQMRRDLRVRSARERSEALTEGLGAAPDSGLPPACSRDPARDCDGGSDRSADDQRGAARR